MGKTVLTTGVFDCGMHIGHFMLIKQCISLAGDDGKVIIGVNSDSSAEKYKRKPIFDQYERMHYLKQLGILDDVLLITSEDDIEEIIKSASVDFYVKGSEWVDKPVTGENLCQVVFFKSTKGYYGGEKISTSDIINAVVKSYNDKITPSHESVLEQASKDKLI
jgi:cytidyltransferase-like protein